MKQYDLYKDSGIEWIGKIPSHWEVKKIKYSFHIYAGATPKTEKKEYWDGDIEWITPADYKTIDKFVSKGQRTITEVGYNSCNTQLVPEGSLIFSKRAPIGTVAISANPLCTNQGCLSCVPKDTNTLFNYYCASIATDYFDLLGSGATFKEISAASFANVKFPCPPFSEQKAIASFLDIQTARIDSIIASREKKIKLLEELRASIITEAVTKGIRKDVEMKDSGIEWIGQIPKHWEVMKVSHIFRIIGSGTTPKTTVNEYYSENGTYWLQTGELKDGLIKETSKRVTSKAIKELGLTIYPKGSVVVAMYGATIGKVGILDIETATNQACCVLANSILMKPLFAFYTIRAAKESLVSLSYGGGQPNISQEKIRCHKLPVPPLAEQDRIIAFIKEKITVLESNTDKARREIELLREYRASLITEVVTGKRKVTE